MNMNIGYIWATAGAKLESVESVAPICVKPADCITEYIKLVVYPDENLDFEMKYRYGDVKYNVRRVLHYMRDTHIPKSKGLFRGLTTIKEPITVYEIEIYRNNKANIEQPE